MVLRVDRNARDRSEEPVIRQGLGPERVDLEAGRRRVARRGPKPVKTTAARATAGPARALRFIRVTRRLTKR